MASDEQFECKRGYSAGRREIAQLSSKKAATTVVERTAIFDTTRPVLSEVVNERPALLVMSTTVDQLYGLALRKAANAAGIDHIMIAPTGEASKTLDTVTKIASTANDIQLSRDGVIVAIGGGILLDIVGCAAMLFRRGLDHVKIGTTLVAQVDAAVGLKCGVNLGSSKNLIGGFHQPDLVLTDPTFLSTVSQRDIRCGLAEMIKLGIVCDRLLFEKLATDGLALLMPSSVDSVEACWLVDRSIVTMIDELNENPFEDQLRRRVDFGHTVSPRLEAETSYRLRHGEAVAVDMAFFSVLSNVLGLLSNDALARIMSIFRLFQIGTWHDLLNDGDLIDEALAAAEAHRGQSLNLPMPIEIGSSSFIASRREITTAAIQEAVRRLRAQAS